MNAASGQLRDELAKVARDMLAAGAGWDRMGDAGWFGLEIGDEFGGSAATFAEVAVILHEQGRAAASTPYLGTAVLGVGALNLLAKTPAAALLAGVAAGDVKLAVALPSGDNRAAGFTLGRSDGGLRLRGEEPFVADAVAADQLLVPAWDPDGRPVIVAAAPGQPGVQVSAQPTVDATRQFGSVAADALVNADAVWGFAAGEPDPFGSLLDRAALAVACDSLGVAEAMLEATVAYVGMRHQFGRPVGSFQAVKHACADMLVQITIGRELLTAAVEAVSTGAGDAWVAVSMAKSFLGSLAVDVAGKALQLHGGFGYTWESGVHAYLKRAVLDRALFGSPSAHRARIASRYSPR